MAKLRWFPTNAIYLTPLSPVKRLGIGVVASCYLLFIRGFLAKLRPPSILILTLVLALRGVLADILDILPVKVVPDVAAVHAHKAVHTVTHEHRSSPWKKLRIGCITKL